MKLKVLILGGNRFFGKRLTGKLLERGFDVTLLNRGNSDDGFGDRVKRIVCDRNQSERLQKAIQGQSWDVVVDQICFDYQTARDACQVFENKTKRYIFTSSQSVYDEGENLVEEDFDPKRHEFSQYHTKDSDYSEAKRQAEVAFERYASFPTVFVRFPIVLGNDDYTGRLKFHEDRIRQGFPIYFPRHQWLRDPPTKIGPGGL